MLAYVDDCMEPAQRSGFESLMAAEPDIRRQIEEWRRQNEAIRAAFGSSREWPTPIRAQTSANENPPAEWMPQPIKSVRASPRLVVSASPAQALVGAETLIPLRQASITRKASPLLSVLAAGAALLASVSSANVTSQPKEMVGASLSAYRTYASGRSNPVEFATSNAGALKNWLAPQLSRASPIPDFSDYGLTLRGGRIVPGGRSPAAFLLYETSAHSRVGLLIEPLDAPAPAASQVSSDHGLATAYWTDSGYGFALTGPLDEEQLIDMSRPVAGD